MSVAVDAAPLDVDMSEGGRFAYAVDPANGGVDMFKVGSDVSLTGLGDINSCLSLMSGGWRCVDRAVAHIAATFSPDLSLDGEGLEGVGEWNMSSFAQDARHPFCGKGKGVNRLDSHRIRDNAGADRWSSLPRSARWHAVLPRIHHLAL